MEHSMIEPSCPCCVGVCTLGEESSIGLLGPSLYHTQVSEGSGALCSPGHRLKLAVVVRVACRITKKDHSKEMHGRGLLPTPARLGWRSCVIV